MAWQQHTPAFAGFAMALAMATGASAQDVKRMDTVVVTATHEGW
jgi:hypothetical protein